MPLVVSSQFLLDNFTGTDGSNLTAHTPDQGGTWAKQTGAAGDMLIINNRTYASATEAEYYNTATPPSPDYEVTGKIRLISSASGQVLSVHGRMVTSAKTSHSIIFYNSGGTYFFIVRRWANGAFADLSSPNPFPLPVQPTVGNDYDMVLRMVGNQISAKFGPVGAAVQVIAPIVDNNLLTTGLAGVGGATSSTTHAHIDTLTAAAVLRPPDMANARQAVKRGALI